MLTYNQVFLKIQSLKNRGDLAGAINLSQLFCSENPGHLGARLDQAYLLIEAQRQPEALRILGKLLKKNKALDLASRNTVLHDFLAIGLGLNKQAEVAPFLTEALSKNSSQKIQALGLNALFKLEKFQAVADHVKLLNLDPRKFSADEVKLFEVVFFSFYKLQRYEELLGLLEGNPFINCRDSPELFILKLNTLWNLKKYGDLEEQIKATRLEISNLSTQTKLLLLHHAQESSFFDLFWELAESIGHTDAGIDLMGFKAKIFYKQGQYEKAFNIWLDLERKYNHSGRYEQLLAHARIGMGIIDSTVKSGIDLSALRSARESIPERKKFLGKLKPEDVDLFSGPEKDKGIIDLMSFQGVGDEIFFLNFLGYVSNEERHRYRFWITKKLIPMYKTCFPGVDFQNTEDNPLLFRSIKKIYLLESALTWAWQRFGVRSEPLLDYRHGGFAINRTGPLNVGISWVSKTTVEPRNKNGTLDEFAETFRAVFLGREITNLYDVNYVDRPIEREELGSMLGCKVQRPEIDFWNDFKGISELFSTLDVLMTVSNVNAHIAGTQGLPTLVYLPHGSVFFYWASLGPQCQFYSSVKIVTKGRSLSEYFGN